MIVFKYIFTNIKLSLYKTYELVYNDMYKYDVISELTFVKEKIIVCVILFVPYSKQLYNKPQIKLSKHEVCFIIIQTQATIESVGVFNFSQFYKNKLSKINKFLSSW